jgi:hypothetical protein
LPQHSYFGISVFKLFEVCSGLIFKSRILFSLFMEFDIYPEKLTYGFLLKSFFIYPSLICGYKLPELGSPVPKMVDSDRIVA